MCEMVALFYHGGGVVRWQICHVEATTGEQAGPSAAACRAVTLSLASLLLFIMSRPRARL